MKCIDCAFAMADGLCLGKGGYTLLDADACESFRPRAGAQAKMLKAENAKLRELVRFIMHQCNDGNPRCDECVGWNGGECVALLRMRELGFMENYGEEVSE